MDGRLSRSSSHGVDVRCGISKLPMVYSKERSDIFGGGSPVLDFDILRASVVGSDMGLSFDQVRNCGSPAVRGCACIIAI